MGSLRSRDTDDDGLEDDQEYQGCSSPTDADSDDDGLLDGAEDQDKNGRADPGESDPCKADSDDDGLLDGTEAGMSMLISADTDPDVFAADQDPSSTTQATLADSDGDGLLDGAEDQNKNGRVDPGESDPNQRDSDGDGVEDAADRAPTCLLYTSPSPRDS